MSNYATLKSAIQSAVYTNGSGEITGAGLQAVLLQIVNTVGDGYVFKGVATGGTSPGTPDENVFYIAPAGTYTNFGSSYTVNGGELGVFTYDGSWAKSKIDIGKSLYEDASKNVSNLASYVYGESLAAATISKTAEKSGYYLNDVGEEVVGSGYRIFTYDVEGAKAFKLYTRMGAVAYAHFYDSNGNIVNGYSIAGNSSAGYNIDMVVYVPLSAVTFRVSFPTNYSITVRPINGLAEDIVASGYNGMDFSEYDGDMSLYLRGILFVGYVPAEGFTPPSRLYINGLSCFRFDGNEFSLLAGFSGQSNSFAIHYRTAFPTQQNTIYASKYKDGVGWLYVIADANYYRNLGSDVVWGTGTVSIDILSAGDPRIKGFVEKREADMSSLLRNVSAEANVESVTEGYYINSSGNDVANGGYSIIRVGLVGASMVHVRTRMSAIAYGFFYDGGGVPLGSFHGNEESGTNVDEYITVPYGTSYMRFGYATSYGLPLVDPYPKSTLPNKQYGKVVAWYGTSIPAGADSALGLGSTGNTYPQLVADNLGMKCYNEALGSSRAKGGVACWGNMDFTHTSRLLGNSIVDMLTLLYNFFTINDNTQTVGWAGNAMGLNASGLGYSSDNLPTYAQAVSLRSTLMRRSYQVKLISRYLDSTGTFIDSVLNSAEVAALVTYSGSKYDLLYDDTMAYRETPDFFVFDHGTNDYTTGLGSDVTSRDMGTYMGAINNFVDAIQMYAPGRRIIIVSDYGTSRYNTTDIIDAQKALAEAWQFPFFNVAEQVPFGGTMVTTRGYWSSISSGHSQNALWHETGFTFTMYDGDGNVTSNAANAVTWDSNNNLFFYESASLTPAQMVTKYNIRSITTYGSSMQVYDIPIKQTYFQDGLHPSSNANGDALKMIADALSMMFNYM